MGMDQSVLIKPGTLINFPLIRNYLATKGLALQMRMIDGELAFPDEEPSDLWKELRVAVGSDMVTIRKSDSRIQLIIWGNATPSLRQTWNALTLALARTHDGKIECPTGEVDPDRFEKEGELPVNWTRDP